MLVAFQHTLPPHERLIGTQGVAGVFRRAWEMWREMGEGKEGRAEGKGEGKRRAREQLYT